MTEEWRAIVLPGVRDDYEVSSLGRVRRTKSCRSGTFDHRKPGYLLKPYINNRKYPRANRYLRVGLCLTNGRRLYFNIHRLVAQAFLGPRPKGYEVNHKSGIKLDNSVLNLEYVTHQENMLHATLNGLRARGETNGRVILTTAQVLEIRRLAGSMLQREIAQQFGVTRGNIGQIARRETWSHI